MRVVLPFLAISLIVLSYAPLSAGEGVAILIDEIRENDHISGTVSGLTEKGREELKVVVYVKTDQWYIHPYERGGEGKSWASIQENGSWKIQTIRRKFSASRIAALVVNRASKVPSTTKNIRNISNEASVVRDLKGTADYGKL